MLTSVAATVVGGREAFDAQTNRMSNLRKVSSDEFQTADLERIQRDERTAPLKVVGGIAKAASGAQGVAAPGVAPNPIMIGFSEGTWAAGKLAEAADEFATAGTSGARETPETDSPADDTRAKTLPGDSGVDIANAPDDYYVAWHFINDGRRYIKLTTVADFRKVSTVDQVMGSGYPENTVKWHRAA